MRLPYFYAQIQKIKIRKDINFMAEKRMFAKSIVLSDAFLDMPMSANVSNPDTTCI